ncbi:MAG: nuclear transport factor 2 family protein [Deltaproteobacteria bacterium]|nr:nuclear transport factor 2 family protein [Deltaproteobacteria bacterium]
MKSHGHKALSRDELLRLVTDWMDAWNRHDLVAVMELFHEDIVFHSWTGSQIKKKRSLLRAWRGWFENHGDFRFETEPLVIDSERQCVTFAWTLDWPCSEPDRPEQREIRHGMDFLRFQDGAIIEKRSYSRTILELDGKKVSLRAV